MERVKLLTCLEKQFNVEELRIVCFRLKIEHEQFNTNDKQAFIRGLIEYCERKGCYDQLVELCSSGEVYSASQTTTTKLRDFDFAVFSGCHAALVKLRNLFQNTLPVPQFEGRRIQQILEFAEIVLKDSPILQRVMGKEWTTELANTVAETIVYSKKMSGRDLVNEVRELKNRPQIEVEAFINEVDGKRKLTARLDILISDLEARLN